MIWKKIYIFLIPYIAAPLENANDKNRKIKVQLIFQAADPNPPMDQKIKETIPIGLTLFEALSKAQDEHKITFEYTDFGGELGAYITSINNVAEYQYGPQHFWMIYSLPEGVEAVLGEKPNDAYLLQLGVSNYLLTQPGERILFYYGHVDFQA